VRSLGALLPSGPGRSMARLVCDPLYIEADLRLFPNRSYMIFSSAGRVQCTVADNNNLEIRWWLLLFFMIRQPGFSSVYYNPDNKNTNTFNSHSFYFIQPWQQQPLCTLYWIQRNINNNNSGENEERVSLFFALAFWLQTRLNGVVTTPGPVDNEFSL
jgi:hypothetical protein